MPLLGFGLERVSGGVDPGEPRSTSTSNECQSNRHGICWT